jgi:hypothetical protein
MEEVIVSASADPVAAAVVPVSDAVIEEVVVTATDEDVAAAWRARAHRHARAHIAMLARASATD